MATTTKSADKPAKTITKPATATKAKTAKAPAKAAAPAAAKPVKKATAPKAPTVKKAPAAKTAKPAVAKKPAAPEPAAEKRRFYVEVAAYYIAERRGFCGSSQLGDWVEAEAEVDRLLQEGVLKP